MQRRGLQLALLGLLVLGLAAPSRAQSAPLSKEERALLAKGELVTRPVEERRGTLRLIGGSSWQVIDAPEAVVWRAMLDTKNYPHMLPAVSGAALVSDRDNLRRVRISHKLGPLGVSYRLAYKVDPERHDMAFKLNDPLDSGMRAAWGFITVQAHGARRSLVSYGVMADPGEGLLVGIARRLIHTWLLRVPFTLKRFVESETGRKLYGSRPSRVCGHLDGGKPQQCAP